MTFVCSRMMRKHAWRRKATNPEVLVDNMTARSLVVVEVFLLEFYSLKFLQALRAGSVVRLLSK